MGGVPCGVQDRVRERQEGFFVANQCRRVCNHWPLVAALLLVLSLVVVRAGNPAWRRRGATKKRRGKLANWLAPIYGWFTEGFDTCDLKEAKALLEELA